MKKLFMFLAVAGLATFGASCGGSDDNGGGTGGDATKQLVAKATPSTVEVNKDVTFSATSEGKAVDGVSFYVGETKLGNPHKFTEAKEYKVVAKKEGFKDSAVITVKVTEAGGPGEKETLKLTILPAEVTLGNAVSFVVYEGTTDVSSSAKIFVNGSEITGASYTATAVGTYSVVAKKDGANDSDAKTFVVTEAVAGNSIVSNGTDFVVDNTIVRSYMTADQTAYQAFNVALDPANPEELTFVTHWILVTHSGVAFNAETENYTYIEVYVPANMEEGLVIFPGDAGAEYYVVSDDEGYAVVEAVVSGDFAPVMSTLNGFAINVDEFVRAEPSSIDYQLALQGAGEDLLGMTYSGECDFGLIPYTPEQARGSKASKFSLNNSVSKAGISKKINKNSVYKLNLNLTKVN